MTTTINIPIGDVEAEVDVDLEYDIEQAVERYFDNNNIGANEDNITDQVTGLLDEYNRQQQGNRTTCSIGESFEQAVEYAALKAFKKLLRQV